MPFEVNQSRSVCSAPLTACSLGPPPWSSMFVRCEIRTRTQTQTQTQTCLLRHIYQTLGRVAGTQEEQNLQEYRAFDQCTGQISAGLYFFAQKAFLFLLFVCLLFGRLFDVCCLPPLNSQKRLPPSQAILKFGAILAMLTIPGLGPKSFGLGNARLLESRGVDHRLRPTFTCRMECTFLDIGKHDKVHASILLQSHHAKNHEGQRQTRSSSWAYLMTVSLS
jgi:hypothetical protein